MIVRFESWGAWVKLESTPAIVALSCEGARELGLDGGDTWNAPGERSAPLEVHLAVTERCGAGCRGCYIDARPDGHEPRMAVLEQRLDALRDAGVFTVAFGGGEPTTRDDLDVLADAAHARGLTPVLTTSGLGLSDARVEKLRGYAQVNVSYDGSAETYAGVRGFDGSSGAERAIERLSLAGVRVGVNVVLTRTSFPALSRTIARARSLGAREVQLLRYKPAGRAASLDYYAHRLSPDQVRELGPTLRRLSSDLCADGDFHIRIDCALVPFLSIDDELGRDPARLARFGVMGCEAANALAAVTADGRVAPCSFAPPSDLSVNDLGTSGETDPHLATWRDWSKSAPEPCASCALRQTCRGGCKVVARFVGEMGSDPECPRVVAHRRASAR